MLICVRQSVLGEKAIASDSKLRANTSATAGTLEFLSAEILVAYDNGHRFAGDVDDRHESCAKWTDSDRYLLVSGVDGDWCVEITLELTSRRREPESRIELLAYSLREVPASALC